MPLRALKKKLFCLFFRRILQTSLCMGAIHEIMIDSLITTVAYTLISLNPNLKILMLIK